MPTTTPARTQARRTRHDFEVGDWSVKRLPDAGTRWYVMHIPTGITLLGGHSTEDRARDFVTAAGGAAALLELYEEAHRILAEPEDSTVLTSVTNHDRARAALTWLIDHAPTVFTAAEESARARALWRMRDRLNAEAAELEQRCATVGRHAPDVRQKARLRLIAAGARRAVARLDADARALARPAALLLRNHR